MNKLLPIHLVVSFVWLACLTFLRRGKGMSYSRLRAWYLSIYLNMPFKIFYLFFTQIQGVRMAGEHYDLVLF